VVRIRPYALADAWGVARRAVLEMCLHATRAGILDFQWELLCPLCRNSNEGSDSLGDINAHVHCQSCNIDYTVNFDRSVELTFRPNAAIRPVQQGEFCVGGPYRTPHIVLQQIVPAGEQRMLPMSLEPGRYRLRTVDYPGGYYLDVDDAGTPALTFHPDPAEATKDELHVATTPTLQFANPGDNEQIFILERTAWNDQAVTAAEVTALQLFRSLFSSEALRPGERITVGSITIVFTDLRGSTRLYREIGDAPAFGRVMNHFDVLREAIASEGGGIVKTIGDAVMAVFQRPVEALRAMLRAQYLLAHPPQGFEPLQLKAGIHSGPCIAVTLNERLDYFGSTVNMAARLEGLSAGQGVIITNDVRFDPEVAEWLAQQQEHLAVEPFTRTLKGFDAEEFELHQVVPLSGAALHLPTSESVALH
jgi:class 3 adenylate cyclase